MTDQIAYKVLTADEWLALQANAFQGAAIDRIDGYVHLSTASQLTETVDRHFGGQENLIIAAVDLGRLRDTVRWEPSRGGQLFPHIYGALTLSAVTAWCSLDRRVDGTVRLPQQQIGGATTGVSLSK
jgi:uncharacterized protein (DUF952 family)